MWCILWQLVFIHYMISTCCTVNDFFLYHLYNFFWVEHDTALIREMLNTSIYYLQTISVSKVELMLCGVMINPTALMMQAIILSEVISVLEWRSKWTLWCTCKYVMSSWCHPLPLMPKGEKDSNGSMLLGGAWVVVLNDKGGDCCCRLSLMPTSLMLVPDDNNS